MHRRILLLITDLQLGGTPTVVRELATRLRDPARHVHVEVACLSEWGPVADQLAAAGAHVTALNARGPRDFPRTLHRLNHLIGSRLFDTCFSFLLHANALAAAASLFHPHVRYLHSVQTTQPDPRWHWTLGRLTHHAATRLVVPSPSVAHALQIRSGVPADKITVIPNAIDPAPFAALRHVPSPDGTYRVGFIGRLDPVKRIPDLLAALELLPPDTTLHIYGDGVERPALESQIRNPRSAIRNRVTLHGAIPSPLPALANLDLLVLPSVAEGFGLVLIEAMAAGVPVVATDVPGIRDVVRPDVTGLLVPVASPPAIASAITRVRTDVGLRDRLTAAARADIGQRFSWDGVMRMYREVLSLPPPPPAGAPG